MSFRPDESSTVLFTEKMFLQGAMLTAVGYGTQMVLFFLCISLLWRQRPKKTYLLLYATVIFILNTLNVASTAAFNQDAFISDRDYPGGPAQFENDQFFIPIDTLGNVSFMLANWAADGLMVRHSASLMCAKH
jgi:hypothetical protein